MATTKDKPTEKQLSEAVDMLIKWFPEEADNLKKHRDAIVSYIHVDKQPQRGSPLLLVQFQAKTELAYASVAGLSLCAGLGRYSGLALYSGLTLCQQAIAKVLVDVVLLVLGLVGLHASNQERIERALIREIGGETLNGFMRFIRAFNEAGGATAKAKVLFQLFRGIYSASGFRAVFKVLTDEMSWWEWVKTVVIAVAQLLIWFGSDGIAFIAEVALNIMSATQLIEDAITAGKVCSK